MNTLLVIARVIGGVTQLVTLLMIASTALSQRKAVKDGSTNLAYTRFTWPLYAVLAGALAVFMFYVAMGGRSQAAIGLMMLAVALGCGFAAYAGYWHMGSQTYAWLMLAVTVLFTSFALLLGSNTRWVQAAAMACLVISLGGVVAALLVPVPAEQQERTVETGRA
jgi:hypothetical protein